MLRCCGRNAVNIHGWCGRQWTVTPIKLGRRQGGGGTVLLGWVFWGIGMKMVLEEVQVEVEVLSVCKKLFHKCATGKIHKCLLGTKNHQ